MVMPETRKLRHRIGVDNLSSQLGEAARDGWTIIEEANPAIVLEGGGAVQVYTLMKPDHSGQ